MQITVWKYFALGNGLYRRMAQGYCLPYNSESSLIIEKNDLPRYIYDDGLLEWTTVAGIGLHRSKGPARISGTGEYTWASNGKLIKPDPLWREEL